MSVRLITPNFVLDVTFACSVCLGHRNSRSRCITLHLAHPLSSPVFLPSQQPGLRSLRRRARPACRRSAQSSGAVPVPMPTWLNVATVKAVQRRQSIEHLLQRGVFAGNDWDNNLASRRNERWTVQLRKVRALHAQEASKATLACRQSAP